MSEIKITVPGYAMQELGEFVSAAGAIEDKRNFRKWRETWVSDERFLDEDWTVTISPPKNVVQVTELSKKKTSKEGDEDRPPREGER